MPDGGGGCGSSPASGFRSDSTDLGCLSMGLYGLEIVVVMGIGYQVQGVRKVKFNDC